MAQLKCTAAWLAIVLATFLGCGPSRPTTYQATGEVTYQGKPVEGAQVMFLAADGRSASGTTDAAGTFTLNTFEAADGVLPGTHQVTITKFISPATTPDNPYPRPTNALPPRYSRAEESQLTAEVTPDGENHFPFELTD
jgi:hypothetical protein